MKSFLTSMLLLLLTHLGLAQNKTLPYYEIPAYPDAYTPGTVAARIIDGAGFRYYWATEGLRTEDLKYKPSVEARTTEQTLQHIYGLSVNIVNSTLKKVNSGEDEELPFEELRRRTLNNFKQASDILKANGNAGLEEFELIFEGRDQNYVYPFWNQLNGPIADALWHIGQVVSHRRGSGNPFDSNVSVLSGKRRE
ncbi:MAG: hypothetical protein RIB47_08285 [Cyclobacteriaceae bacterium]